MDKEFKLPKDFLWGSATSSYQVEGGIENNDWAEAARHGKVPEAGQAADHFIRYEEDFDSAKNLGHNAHRLSIEWARVEPRRGEFNEAAIMHYRNVLRALRIRGLEPFVTLWHFTLPDWFSKMGGFNHSEASALFSRYCVEVIGALQGEARFWITMNEPMVYASEGHQKGAWPPFKKNFFSYLATISSLIHAHRKTYSMIKRINPSLQIGIAKHNICFESDHKLWNTFARNTLDWFWNRRFLNGIVQYQDFIGLNYYMRHAFGRHESFPKTDMGWEVYPEGLYKTLLDVKTYGVPIYITENGIADESDTKRAQFLYDHITALKRAVLKGVPVKGYFYWSLLDNFEWAHGFTKRFGLLELDYATMKRTIRPSALEYKKIILSS